MADTYVIKIKTSHLAENNKEQLGKYECPKCEHILTDAVQTSCGHWLCQDCAEEVFKKTEGTPYCPRMDCGEELIADQGRPFFPDRFVRKEIGRFVVACINRKFGCSWEGKMGELGNHLGTCKHNKTECKHCNRAFSPLEYKSHVDQCPKMTVACPLKDHGCKETEEMSREECIEHVASKTGIYSHFFMIASILSSLVPSSSTDTQEGERRNCVESDGGYESLPKVRSASPKAIVSTGGPDPRGSDLGFLEDKGRLENEFYCTLSAKEKALGPSQYYDEEQGQGHGRDDLTVTDLSPAGSLTVTFCPHCNSNILSSEPDNHKCIVTCPLKDHGCKETKEMSLEECIEHVSSKTGFYSHFLMIARFLSSIVPTGSTEAQEREGGNYGEGDDGYDSLHQALSTSQTVARKPDGPDPGENESGFLEDGGAGADDEPMSLTTTLRA